MDNYEKSTIEKLALRIQTLRKEAEITAKAVRNGFKPIEVPIYYNPRTHAEGKSIRWYHAYPIIKTLIKYAWFS